MKIKFFTFISQFFLLVGLSITSAAIAHGFQIGDISIQHPYAIPSIAGSSNGAVFFKHIKNAGKETDQLISVRTQVAEKTEIHEMKMDGDVMKMRALTSIDIPAGVEVSVAKGNPNGYHLMLLGLKKPLKDGDKFPVWLTFKKAGVVEVEVWVQLPTEVNKPEEHKH
jgi:copper(I)-binding protein